MAHLHFSHFAQEHIDHVSSVTVQLLSRQREVDDPYQVSRVDEFHLRRRTSLSMTSSYDTLIRDLHSIFAARRIQI